MPRIRVYGAMGFWKFVWRLLWKDVPIMARFLWLVPPTASICATYAMLNFGYGLSVSAFVVVAFVAVLAALIAVRALVAAYNAEKRLASEISVSIDAAAAGCPIIPINIPLATGKVWRTSSKWVQFIVSPTNSAPLIDCEARVLAITRINHDGMQEALMEEPAYCRWSNLPEGEVQTIRTTIPPLVRQRANLFWIRENGPVESLILPKKIKLEEEIIKKGRYRIDIVVSASGTATKNHSFLFSWDQDFATVSLEMIG